MGCIEINREYPGLYWMTPTYQEVLIDNLSLTCPIYGLLYNDWAGGVSWVRI